MAEHGGAQAVAAARRHGVQTMFTLSGGHVFPLYDGAVHAEPPMRILDVRHEQTAVFAAEATARLTREPGLAVLTAGPGVTNGISAVTTAHFNGSAVVILAGRAPDYRWGAGSLQEIDHPQLLAPVTKRAWTEHAASGVGASVDEAFRLAAAPHRGPVFLDAALEALFGPAGRRTARPAPQPPRRARAPQARTRRRWTTLCWINCGTAGGGPPPGAGPGLGRLARRSRRAGPGGRGGAPAARGGQRAGARDPAGRA